jgi:hypothetical protein
LHLQLNLIPVRGAPPQPGRNQNLSFACNAL